MSDPAGGRVHSDTCLKIAQRVTATGTEDKGGAMTPGLRQ